MKERNEAMLIDIQKELITNEVIKYCIKRLILKCYSWHNYNPRGEYVNICFTLKGADMYQFVNAELKKAKVVKLEM